MSETKWSTGPWERDDVMECVMIGNHPHRVYPVASPSTETGIAICILPREDDSPKDRATVEANAHLIAASPTLYAALEKARICIGGSANSDGHTLLQEIDNALALARGEVHP